MPAQLSPAQLSPAQLSPVLAGSPALSHTKPQRTRRRHGEARKSCAGILAPFLLRVIKKELPSCRSHDSIFHAGARSPRRRYDQARESTDETSAYLRYLCGEKQHLALCLARPMHALLFDCSTLTSLAAWRKKRRGRLAAATPKMSNPIRLPVRQLRRVSAGPAAGRPPQARRGRSTPVRVPVIR